MKNARYGTLGLNCHHGSVCNAGLLWFGRKHAYRIVTLKQTIYGDSGIHDPLPCRFTSVPDRERMHRSSWHVLQQQFERRMLIRACAAVANADAHNSRAS